VASAERKKGSARKSNSIPRKANQPENQQTNAKAPRMKVTIPRVRGAVELEEESGRLLVSVAVMLLLESKSRTGL
jgi:hypothetical protein